MGDLLTINRCEFGAFRVEVGGKHADGLTFDEMLGLVASVSIPEKRPCIHWLKTLEQWKALHDHYANRTDEHIEDADVAAFQMDEMNDAAGGIAQVG